MFKHFVAMIVLALSVACVSTPPVDTNEKRLLVTEIAFNEVLTTVHNAKARLSASQRSRAAEGLREAKKALEAARLALNLGDTLAFDDNVAIANSSISILRGILEEAEKREVSYEYNYKLAVAA